MIEQADAIYRLVGTRIRARRRLLGLTQTEVAQACGTSFQQLQKYESGATAISVDRLLALADALTMKPEDLLGL